MKTIILHNINTKHLKYFNKQYCCYTYVSLTNVLRNNALLIDLNTIYHWSPSDRILHLPAMGYRIILHLSATGYRIIASYCPNSIRKTLAPMKSLSFETGLNYSSAGLVSYDVTIICVLARKTPEHDGGTSTERANRLLNP